MGYFLRVYSKRPVHTLAIILILGCGIAVTTFTFTLFNSILLEPLPYPESERIVKLWAKAPYPRNFFISTPTYDDICEQSTVFDSLCASEGQGVNLSIRGSAIRAVGWKITNDFFQVYRSYPSIGTIFDEKNQNGIILFHQLWLKEFGGDPDIIGKSVTLDGIPTPIIGVMPKDFAGGQDFTNVDYFTSFDIHKTPWAHRRNIHFVYAIGRLKKEISLEQAQAELDVIANRLKLEKNAEMQDVAVKLTSINEDATEYISHSLKLAMGGSLVLFTLVLLLVGNLLLAGWLLRIKEFGTRIALGASRNRLVMQLISESVLLSVLGGLLGLGISIWMSRLFRLWAPPGIPRIEGLATEEMVILFWLITTILGGLLPGFISALACSRVESIAIMKGSGSTGIKLSQNRFFSSIITVFSIALSCLLLTLTGLLGFSYLELVSSDLGYQPKGVITALANLSTARYKEDNAKTQYHDDLLNRIRAIPGVESAGCILGASSLFTGGGIRYRLNENDDDIEYKANYIVADVEALDALELKLKKGRFFNNSDKDRPETAVVVDEAFARLHWPGTDALNKSFYDGDETCVVVGVINSIRSRGYDGSIIPTVYNQFSRRPLTFQSFVIKSVLPEIKIIKSLQEAARQTDPYIALYDIHTLEKRLQDDSSLRRISAQTVLLLGLIGALISCIGIYAVILFDLSNRKQEIGIRAALGASTFHIYKHFLKKGLVLILVGIALGLGSTYYLLPIISRSIFKLPAMTSGVQLFTAIVVLILGTISCLLAIRRSLDQEKIYTCLKQE